MKVRTLYCAVRMLSYRLARVTPVMPFDIDQDEGRRLPSFHRDRDNLTLCQCYPEDLRIFSLFPPINSSPYIIPLVSGRGRARVQAGGLSRLASNCTLYPPILCATGCSSGMYTRGYPSPVSPGPRSQGATSARMMATDKPRVSIT